MARVAPPGKAVRKWAMALAVSVLFAMLAAQTLDLARAVQGLSAIPPLDWLIVISLAIAMAILRALRIRTALPEAPLTPIMRASFIHGAANATLPARLGEAALPIMLQRLIGLDLAKAFGLLLAVRFLDLMTILAFGFAFLAALLIGQAPFEATAIAFASLAFFAAGARLPAILHRMPHFTKGPAFLSRLKDGASLFAGPTNLKPLIITCFIHLACILAGSRSVAALAPELPFVYAGLAVVAASLAFSSPINGAANFGPYEAAFASVIILGGGSADAALASAIHLHLCTLIAALLCGGAATLFPSPDENTRNTSAVALAQEARP